MIPQNVEKNVNIFLFLKGFSRHKRFPFYAVNGNTKKKKNTYLYLRFNSFDTGNQILLKHFFALNLVLDFKPCF